MKPKKRNKQDATLINITSLKKRVEALEIWAHQHSIASSQLYGFSALIFENNKRLREQLKTKRKK